MLFYGSLCLENLIYFMSILHHIIFLQNRRPCWKIIPFRMWFFGMYKYQRFGETYSLHFQALKMEAAYSSHMLVLIHHTTWCPIPEDLNLNIHCCEKLKPHIFLKDKNPIYFMLKNCLCIRYNDIAEDF